MAYICGMGMISPQNSLDNMIPPVIGETAARFLTCREPDYKQFLSSRQSRRMSRITRMGVCAAIISLREAGVKIPDAIITGTGLGCMQDTETFLRQIAENDEAFLIPTSFIHSTHNTIGSQVALVMGCTGYNQTYTHKSVSFESALQDGLLWLEDDPQKKILVGGMDEIVPSAFKIQDRLGYWKRCPTRCLDLLNSNSKGTIAGEGAGFFCLSKAAAGTIPVRVSSVSTFYRPESIETIHRHLADFLSDNHKSMTDIDLLMLGVNGDIKNDSLYHQLGARTFKGRNRVGYKHLCGEYSTSTAFAMWLGTNIIQQGHVPNYLKLNPFEAGSVDSVLVYNHFQNRNHSLLLLEKTGHRLPTPV